MLQGSVALIVFDNDGVVEFSEVFGQEFDSKIMEIGSMIWHTVIVCSFFLRIAIGTGAHATAFFSQVGAHHFWTQSHTAAAPLARF